MHFPPYHKKRSWQIFLVGTLIGAIVAYTMFAYMYGKMYESLLSENMQIKTKIGELERQNEALLQDKEDMEEKSANTIQSIGIDFSNSEELKLDRLIIHELEDLIKNEINFIIGKDVKSLSENDDLLITLLENKTFTIDDFSYQFEVNKMFVSEQVKITLHVKLSE
ncbi:sporulation membrane protein YtrI [Pseudogracilibacillus sp. SO30301A]|uniref:sporulation membrane protein YtrI n=1 Tax=Pseudogracilibacillus sp. SO30301A TaxID=3098291 RepID=UPI00300DC966